MASLGQYLMPATRPKVLIAPLQTGLGVAANHLTGSKHLVGQLFSLGNYTIWVFLHHMTKLSASLDQKTDLVGKGPNSWI